MRHLAILLLLFVATAPTSSEAASVSSGTLLVDLVPGKTWSWRHVGSGSSSDGGSRYQRSFEMYGRLRLTILSVGIDSGTRMRCEVQTRSDDSTYILPGGLFGDSWSTSSVLDTLILQVDSQAGSARLLGGDDRYNLIASGLLGFPTDLQKGEGTYVRTHYKSAHDDVIFPNDETMRKTDTITLRKTFGAVSIHFTDMFTTGNSVTCGSYSDVSGTLELLSMDSMVLSDGDEPPNPWRNVSVRRGGRDASDRIASLADLAQELSVRPVATVRLTSVSGRSEIHSGLEVLRALRTRHGIVFVELRDGDLSMRGRLLLH